MQKTFTTGKKYLLAVVVLLFVCIGSVQGQMLETVDFSTPTTTNINTYVNDISNSGYACGYYTLPSGTNIGFIISSSGRKLVVNPLIYSALSGFTDTKVTGINDHGVAVVYATSSTASGIFKVYIDTTGDTISSIASVTGIAEATAVPFKINNLNDITGWFSASTRYFFIDHDSIVPSGKSTWEATRYEDAVPTFYNTEAGGINDANKGAGFYFSGSTQYPYVYDDATGFTLISSPYSTRFWDINNSNVVAGEYKQTSGVWMAFYGQVSGSSLTMHSLSSIFYSNSIQSVANGINDKGTVVGSFVHPVTGKWNGFIYHPNISEYRIPGFSFAKNTWSMLNSNAGGPNPIWTGKYWGGSKYATRDPYANITTPPLLDSFILSLYVNPAQIITAMTDSVSPGWKGFANEIDGFHTGTSTIPGVQSYYANILKHAFWTKYLAIGPSNAFSGYCYGFSYSALLRYFNDTLFSSWFGLPLGTDISQVTDTNKAAVLAVERFYLKQNDQAITNRYNTPGHHTECQLWEGLYRLKNTYQLPIAYSNPRSVAIALDPASGGGYHNILPYKIRTPRKLPFNYPTTQYDTMFVYDSNYPKDSTQYFTVNSATYAPDFDSAYNVSYPGFIYINFNKPGIRELYNKAYTAFKPTGASTNSQYLNFNFRSNLYYGIEDTGGTHATLNAAGFSNTSANLNPLYKEEITTPNPVSFNMDTTYSVKATTYHYTDSSMVWTQSNTQRSMSISRSALPAEKDNTTIKNRFISYGNPDAVTKTLTASYTETTNDLSQGSSILISGICAMPGDSIVTKNPYPFAYQVIREKGSSTCTYKLTVYAAYSGDVHEFNATVDMTGNTSHIIDPYYVGTKGYQTVIYVDHGLTGSNSDTLFVSPTSINPNIGNIAGITVSPNPVYNNNDLKIDFASTVLSTYHIRLCNILGRTVYSSTVSVAAGSVKVPMAANVPGLYILQVRNDQGDIVYTDKIVKE